MRTYRKGGIIAQLLEGEHRDRSTNIEDRRYTDKIQGPPTSYQMLIRDLDQINAKGYGYAHMINGTFGPQIKLKGGPGPLKDPESIDRIVTSLVNRKTRVNGR